MPVDDHRHPAHGGNRASERATSVVVVNDLTPEQEWFNQMRVGLIGVATLAAFATYRAGLNPPGGNPALHDRAVKQYLTAFHYFNTTALVGSVVTIFLLLSKRFYLGTKVAALTLTGLMGLLGACIAGSMRDLPSSMYLVVLTCFVFVFVVYISTVLLNLKKRVEGARKREEDEEEAEKIHRSGISGRALAA